MKKTITLGIFALILAMSSGVLAQDIKKSSPEFRQQPAKTKTPKKGADSKIPAKKKAVKPAPAKSTYKK